MTLVKRNDNRCVSVMTNHESDLPLARAKRWDRSQRSHRMISQPRLIHNYNQNMGGVDSHDWLCGKYATGIRGKKWYWCLFTRMLDMAVVNAWLLHRLVQTDGSPLSLLEFRRQIAVAYMRATESRPQRSMPPPTAPGDVRYDGKGHLVVIGDRQRRCRMNGCQKRPSYQCAKCKVTLCIACFSPYHQP